MGDPVRDMIEARLRELQEAEAEAKAETQGNPRSVVSSWLASASTRGGGEERGLRGQVARILGIKPRRRLLKKKAVSWLARETEDVA